MISLNREIAVQFLLSQMNVMKIDLLVEESRREQVEKELEQLDQLQKKVSHFILSLKI